MCQRQNFGGLVEPRDHEDWESAQVLTVLIFSSIRVQGKNNLFDILVGLMDL